MLNFRLNFGSDFSCAFNFVWWISRDLSVRSGWFSEALGVFDHFRSLQPQIGHSFDIHMSFCASKVDISGPKMKILRKKWCFPNRSGINLGWSLDLQDIKKHHFGWVPSCQTLQKNPKNDKLKKSKISRKTQAFDDFLDLIFSNFPCWRMCCLAAGLEEILKWLVEHISGALE